MITNITLVVTCVLYGVWSYFVGSSYFEVRKMKKVMERMVFDCRALHAIILSEKMRQDIKDVEEMKQRIQQLAEEDEFEAAQQMTEAMEGLVREINNSAEFIHREFGDIVDFQFKAFKKRNNERYGSD